MKKLLLSNSFRPSNQSLRSLALAVGVFISRLGMLPANFSPLGSFGFASGSTADSASTKLNRWWQVSLYMASILAYDLWVGGSYRGASFTYAGFLLYPLLGWLSRKSIRHQILALPTASFGFFLLSNIGVWWFWYDHTWQDLIRCFILAAPFYTRTLISDLIFGYGWLAYGYSRANKNALVITTSRNAANQPAVQTTA